MTRTDVRSVIARLEDPWKLAAQLIYGSGLRVMETLRLRVKDLDFGHPLAILRPDADGPREREAIEFAHATPLEYLSRWLASNEVFGDDARLVSAMEAERPRASKYAWVRSADGWPRGLVQDSAQRTSD